MKNVCSTVCVFPEKCGVYYQAEHFDGKKFIMLKKRKKLSTTAQNGGGFSCREIKKSPSPLDKSRFLR